ncbi:MAG: hypothetical protein LBS89_00575 [Zoogloeaceae bacterium]|jgi:hypothetical protein|nr:hypothetical protein [Zoogloeaceae bacterium]
MKEACGMASVSAGHGVHSVAEDSAGEGRAGLQPGERLPTLQRNALCKFFSRADFSPADIVALGYPRLQKISGIGPKGLDIVLAWVRLHGLDLSVGESEKTERQALRVERAIRWLEKQGYEVRRRKRKGSAAPGKSTPK